MSLRYWGSLSLPFCYFFVAFLPVSLPPFPSILVSVGRIFRLFHPRDSSFMHQLQLLEPCYT